MATLVPVGIIFTIMLMISPAYTLNCTTQKFSSNRVFQNCSDLPVLTADGWVSWAINPNGAYMAGAQSLIAFRQGGSLVVKPFVLNNYSSIVQTNLSYPVSGTSAEVVDGKMTLFAIFQLPEKMTKFYHIWQVGAAVASGVPRKHEFEPANLNAKGTLDLIAGLGGSGGAPAIGTPGSPSPSIAPGGSHGGDSGIRKSNMSFYLFLVLGSFIVLCF
ncbi:hypothetical protein AAG906_038905 [Vitis piasezkii]